jgi:HSP20 family protein
MSRSSFDPFDWHKSIVDQMFQDPFFSRRGFEDPFALVRRDMSSGQSFFTPRVDVWDSGDALMVHADLPGVPKENVSIEIHNGNLHIDGRTSEDKEYDKFDSRIRERRFGKFSRVITLPPGIDPSKVQAEFKNGVLEMNIPKKVESMPLKISIN